mmetsp:Transcript_31953/g.66824  ORF Transcript_31953/g.66824 Transcript_31953/m.66824 type:complete len:255 (-) Transcript_31953:1113-1877(-)
MTADPSVQRAMRPMRCASRGRPDSASAVVTSLITSRICMGNSGWLCGRSCTVRRSSSPVSSERLVGGALYPDIQASASASAAGPCSSRSFSAVGRKKGSSSGFTSWTLSLARAAEASMTSPGWGAPRRSNLMPASRSMRVRRKASAFSKRTSDVPLRPARPVRPARWMKVSESRGTPKWTTRSMWSMSRPRAATSVAMSTGMRPVRKPLRIFSRTFWGMSPCRASVPLRIMPSSATRSSASRLVLTKTSACCVR